MTSQVIYGLALGVFSYFQYALLGVPYPFLMAVITGVLSLIPTIGGLLASLIVAIPCLLLGSTVFTEMPNLTFALLALLINVVITQLTYNFLALPIVGRFVNLPTAVVLVGVLVGVALGSIVLAFLAVARALPGRGRPGPSGGGLLQPTAGLDGKQMSPPMNCWIQDCLLFNLQDRRSQPRLWPQAVSACGSFFTPAISRPSCSGVARSASTTSMISPS
jgi:uncharacterized membrane protein